MFISVLLGFMISMGAFNVEYAQSVYELTIQVRTDSLQATIAGLSGEVPVSIDGEPDSIPCRFAITTGAYRAALWLAEQLEARGFSSEVVEFEVDLSSLDGPLPLGTERKELEALLQEVVFANKPAVMWNVVATLPGKDSCEVLLTAHYDAISDRYWVYTSGADDNASGVAGVLETARILADGDWDHTLKFILFGGEELGLLGSYAYVADVVEAGEKDKILGVLNLDMIAYDGDGIPEIDIHCHPWQEPSQEQGQMLADMIDVYGFNLTADIHTKDATDRSDHYPFWPRQIPAMLLIEDFEDFTPFYHTTGDRLSTLDSDYMTEAVKASVAWVATMANTDAFVPAVTEQPHDLAQLPSIVCPSTILHSNSWFQITTPCEVTPVIYDATGRRVKRLVPVSASSLPQRIPLYLATFEPGVYWVSIPGTKISRKFVLIR